jgi:hypothetical protein
MSGYHLVAMFSPEVRFGGVPRNCQARHNKRYFSENVYNAEDSLVKLFVRNCKIGF